MHTLVLHGSLSSFGESFTLSSKTAHGMIKLVARQIKGLKQAIKEGKFRLLRDDYEYADTIVNGRYLELDLQLGNKPRTLHLIPVLEGAGGDSGVGKILIGAVIMVAAVVASPFTGGTSFAAAMGASSSLFGITYGTFFALGASIALAGVSQLIAPKADFGTIGSMENADETPSYFMTSPVNMANENGALPIVFGECFAGSLIINGSLDNYDIIAQEASSSNLSPLTGLSLLHNPLRLTWENRLSHGTPEYVIKTGTNWDTGEVFGRTTGSSINIPESPAIYMVKDTYGSIENPTPATISISTEFPVLTATTSGNSLSWNKMNVVFPYYVEVWYRYYDRASKTYKSTITEKVTNMNVRNTTINASGYIVAVSTDGKKRSNVANFTYSRTSRSSL